MESLTMFAQRYAEIFNALAAIYATVQLDILHWTILHLDGDLDWSLRDIITLYEQKRQEQNDE